MFFDSQERRINFGLLVMRFGLATVLLIHSLPVLMGGAAYWKNVGTSLNFINIGISPQVLGFVIMLFESLCGVSLLSGFLFRTSCVILTVIYGLYFFNYLNIGYKTLTLYSLGLALVFIGLMNTGPGRYAVAVKLERK
jgi:uncharacterized membrane protein YphA (DoxX/SURF4 family)